MTPGPTHSGNYVQPWGLWVPPGCVAVRADIHATSRQNLETERQQVNDLVALGVTQESIAARTAEIHAADSGIIVAGHNGNPMNVGASATQWKEQADYRKPTGRAEAPITKFNPMGC